MKNLVFGSFLVGLAAVASAGTVSVGFSPWQTQRGGEFRITVNSGYAGEVGLFSDPTGSSTFQTFCIETNEFLGLTAGPYDYTVDPDAIAGGSGGPQPDPVDPATGWLYSQFRRGTLAGYDYANSGTGRISSAATLQQVFWQLENESLLNVLTGPESAQAALWYTAAIAHSADTTTYGVRALNLTHYDDQGVLVRDQTLLTIIPLPTAAWMGLSGLGLVALRRRRA